MPGNAHTRLDNFSTIAMAMVALLAAKVLVSILWEYRWYFPPNFDSAFLTGREATFTTLYATAFYMHLVSGPLTILLTAWLFWSGGKPHYCAWHRWAGRTQVAIVLALLMPSGLVMARNAFAGPIAGFGFAALSIATGASAAATMYYAVSKRFAQHQRWAGRCTVLLFSPLLLRLVSGALIVTQCESDWSYRANAWLSWLVPLLIFEVWQAQRRIRTHSRSRLLVPLEAYP